MRHAIPLGNDFWMGVDNAAGIGEKTADSVKADNSLVAEMATRVALLELWCAGAEPQQVIIINFTGTDAWESYEHGVEKLFRELGTPCPPISGSTESNMDTAQSGLSIQLIGRREKKCWYLSKKNTAHVDSEGNWFLIGMPLVGQEVLATPYEVVSLKELQSARRSGAISYIHPCGSSGVQAELDRLGILPSFSVPPGSAGPSTCVIVKSALSLLNLQNLFTSTVQEI